MNLRSVTAPAAACALLGCTSAPAPTPLDGLIGFVDPHWCTPDADFRALLDSAVQHVEAGESYRPTVAKPVVPKAFERQIGEPQLAIDGSEYRATLPLTGTWRGLPLRSLVIFGWIESEQGFRLVFDATPAQVLQTVNRAGFNIPASGRVYREGDVMGMNVSVEGRDGGGALSCVPG